jgi:hypothetical protein
MTDNDSTTLYTDAAVAGMEAEARVPVTRTPGGRMTPSERARMLERYASGERVKVLCRDYGISHSSLWKASKRAGIPARRPKEPGP